MKEFILKINIEKFLTLGYFSKIPQRQLVYGYLSYMMAGAVLLSLPISQKQDNPGILDNLFTSVSAVTTTGLSTINIADTYTFFGQLVILLLVQLGGIGYMTLSSYLVLRITHHLTPGERTVLNTEFAMPQGMTIQSLLRSIIIFTCVFQTAGAVGLTYVFHVSGSEDPLWKGIFHSVSAFCTAGFGLYADSFVQYRYNFGVNAMLAVLSYAGAMGFIVLLDLWRRFKCRKHQITFTTKIISLVTAVLTIFGTSQIYFFEPSIQELDDYSKLTVAFFQTMSAMTTAGFNSINISAVASSTLMVMVVLMFIGASPSGTGGGLKSTTFTTIWAYMAHKLSLSKSISLFGSKIPDHRVQAAITTFIFYTVILFAGTYLLTFTESISLIQLLFEAGSALGTVGLSTGITGEITANGKFILIILMFVGRVGVLTFGNAMLVRHYNHMKSSDIAF